MIRVLSRRGDDRKFWDSKKAQEGELSAIAAVAEAVRIFELEKARGATAFKVEEGKPTQRIDMFDPTAEQIVIVPKVVGG